MTTSRTFIFSKKRAKGSRKKDTRRNLHQPRGNSNCKCGRRNGVRGKRGQGKGNYKARAKKQWQTHVGTSPFQEGRRKRTTEIKDLDQETRGTREAQGSSAGLGGPITLKHGGKKEVISEGRGGQCNSMGEVTTKRSTRQYPV